MSIATALRMGAPAGTLLLATAACSSTGTTYFAGGDYCEVNSAGWKN